MKSNYLFCLVIFNLLVFSTAAVVPEDPIEPCDNLSEECLTTAVQKALPRFMKGIPNYGIISLDPFIIDKLDLVLPGGLTVAFRKGVAKGFKGCSVDSARIMYDNIFEINMHCNVTIIGKYKSAGQLLMFTLDGDGDALIKARNLSIQLLAELRSVKGADGNKYLEIINFKYAVSYDGRITYRFTNLLNGRPDLSKGILDFMNENWQLIAEEFGKPLVDFGIDNIIKNVKHLLKVVPMNSLISAPVNF